MDQTEGEHQFEGGPVWVSEKYKYSMHMDMIAARNLKFYKPMAQTKRDQTKGAPASIIYRGVMGIGNDEC